MNPNDYVQSIRLADIAGCPVSCMLFHNEKHACLRIDGTGVVQPDFSSAGALVNCQREHKELRTCLLRLLAQPSEFVSKELQSEMAVVLT
jgi:hypothetical protein